MGCRFISVGGVGIGVGVGVIGVGRRQKNDGMMCHPEESRRINLGHAKIDY